MCKLNVSVKNSYVYLELEGRTVRFLVSPLLKAYTKVIKFDKTNGVLIMSMSCQLKDGSCIEDEDYIDLNEELGFAFRNPRMIIDRIDDVKIA